MSDDDSPLDKAIEILTKNIAQSSGQSSGDDSEIQKLQQGLESERANAEIIAESLRQIVRMRGIWSLGLLILIGGIILLNYVFVFFMGFHWLEFDNQWVFPIFIGQSILQIVGMGFIVVQFLFDHKALENEG